MPQICIAPQESHSPTHEDSGDEDEGDVADNLNPRQLKKKLCL